MATLTAVITGLTEDTTPEVAADFIPTYDNSATSLKKVKPSSILTQLQGDGLTSAQAGFRNIPQNSQSDNYTLVAADSGKHIYETGASKTVTIPANASVAFPIGTTVTFIATDAGGCSIAITSDTLRWAEGGGTGTRTLAQYGLATAIKVTSTAWIISGTGLS